MAGIDRWRDYLDRCGNDGNLTRVLATGDAIRRICMTVHLVARRYGLGPTAVLCRQINATGSTIAVNQWLLQTYELLAASTAASLQIRPVARRMLQFRTADSQFDRRSADQRLDGRYHCATRPFAERDGARLPACMGMNVIAIVAAGSFCRVGRASHAFRCCYLMRLAVQIEHVVEELLKSPVVLFKLSCGPYGISFPGGSNAAS